MKCMHPLRVSTESELYRRNFFLRFFRKWNLASTFDHESVAVATELSPRLGQHSPIFQSDIGYTFGWDYGLSGSRCWVFSKALRDSWASERVPCKQERDERNVERAALRAGAVGVTLLVTALNLNSFTSNRCKVETWPPALNLWRWT